MHIVHDQTWVRVAAAMFSSLHFTFIIEIHTYMHTLILGLGVRPPAIDRPEAFVFSCFSA